MFTPDVHEIKPCWRYWPLLICNVRVSLSELFTSHTTKLLLQQIGTRQYRLWRKWWYHIQKFSEYHFPVLMVWSSPQLRANFSVRTTVHLPNVLLQGDGELKLASRSCFGRYFVRDYCSNWNMGYCSRVRSAPRPNLRYSPTKGPSIYSASDTDIGRCRTSL